MSPAHLHLVLNHLPILAVPFGIALLAAGVLRHSRDLKLAALATFVLAALLAVPVYLTGEPAEEQIEHRPGFSELYLERHEDLALYSLVLTAILGAASAASLAIWRRRELPGTAVTALLLLSLLATASLGLTAAAGGPVGHAELRQGR
ncbi:MAG: hypothetical protein HY319_09810 [Armatimonadetes bacterium]|nr:hypothetical protein [Armatimonadota bacterium]